MPIDDNEDDFSVYDETIKSRRKTFINTIQKSNPNAYKEYKKIEKQAKEGEDPFRLLIRILGKENEDLREEIRYILIRERLISPSNEDVEKLSSVLKEHEIDLKSLCNEIEDPRAIADIIVHMNLEKYLDKSSLGGVYFIIDKIISENKTKSKKYTRGSTAIPSTYFKIPEVSDIYNQILINQYLKEFQNDFISAEKDLIKKISETEDVNLRKNLEFVFKYYYDLNIFKIQGIKSKITDSETNKEINFPSFHQKITTIKLLKDKRVLLADDMGLGKTAQAIISKYAIEQEHYKKTGERKKVTSLVVVPTNDLIEHWKSQIELFCEEKPSIGIIKSSNKNKIDDIIEKNPDFILVTYDMIFREYEGKKISDYILEKSNISYVVLDEVHNVKNPKTLRSKEIEQIATSEKINHLLILSGSPFPNGFKDVGVIIHLLKPEKYPSPKDFVNAFSKNPRLVRDELLSRLIRRTNDEVYCERDCETNIVKIEPNSFQISSEQEILSKDSSVLEKIKELRKLFIDPSLIGYDGDSEKYNMILENVKSNNGKSIIFSSDLREGITEKLEDFLNENNVSTVRIDGTVQGKDRESVIKMFREGNAQVLVTTLNTMGEGNDFSCANNVELLDIPFTYAKYIQGITRVLRKGQKEKVNVNLYMYDGSLDEKLWKVIHQKKRYEKILLDGMPLTSEEIKILIGSDKELIKIIESKNKVNEKIEKVELNVKDEINSDAIKKIERKVSKKKGYTEIKKGNTIIRRPSQ
jgi:SNF2 family DNA or RNA helicase